MNETKPETIANDEVVQIAYNLSVSGEEIESNVLEYIHGHKNIIAGLEQGLTGLSVGETKEVHVPAKDAYGEFDPDSVITVTRKSFPADFEIKLNQPMNLRDQHGHFFQAVATDLTEHDVTLDMNHPMAGKDLDFKVTVLSVRPATEDELRAGHLYGGGCAGCASDCGDGCGDGCGEGSCH